MPIDESEIVIDFSETVEIAQIASLLSANASLSKIIEQLSRAGYSHCEECGEEIPKRRREVFPSARTCVSCQELIELDPTRRLT